MHRIFCNYETQRERARKSKKEKEGTKKVSREGMEEERGVSVIISSIIFQNPGRDSRTPLCTAPVLWLINAGLTFVTFFNYRTVNEIYRLKRLGSGKKLHVLHTSSSVCFYGLLRSQDLG
jgi:hypothetical protein